MLFYHIDLINSNITYFLNDQIYKDLFVDYILKKEKSFYRKVEH